MFDFDTGYPAKQILL